MKDYYEILEVHPKASQEIIKKAYQTLAKKYHPDTTTLPPDMARKKMAEINEAFDILSNNESRAKYNDLLTGNGSGSNGNYPASQAEQYIYDLCNKTLKSISRNIIASSGRENYNIGECTEISSYFDSKIYALISEINNTHADTKEIFNLIGLTYWKIACSYTWTWDALTAEKYADLSTKYISSSATFYNDFTRSIYTIKNNAKLFREHASKKKRNKILRSLVFGGMILFVIISAFNSPSSPNSKPIKTSNQTESKQIPIAKENVFSQYDNSQKILNNDGMCEITVDNSKNDMPVYVRIWDKRRNLPVRAFTINKNSRFVAQNLSPGIYDVRYKELYENDLPAHGSKSETIKLEENYTDDGTQYSIVSLTLYKVQHGNTKITEIPVDQI